MKCSTVGRLHRYKCTVGRRGSMRRKADNQGQPGEISPADHSQRSYTARDVVAHGVDTGATLAFKQVELRWHGWWEGRQDSW